VALEEEMDLESQRRGGDADDLYVREPLEPQQFLQRPSSQTSQGTELRQHVAGDLLGGPSGDSGRYQNGR